MKKLYIAIAFLIIALGLCVFEQYTVQSAYHQTTEYIDNAMEGLEKNDYKAVEKSCDMLSKYWNKKYPIMTAMIDHGPLDDASVTINSLNDLAKNKMKIFTITNALHLEIFFKSLFIIAR